MNKQDNSKQRLFEVMSRLDKTFKTKLNEEMESSRVSDDPTKEEMQEFLRQKYHTEDDFDVEAAIYWFANYYHGGQNSNLYSALSTSEFRPSPMSRGIEDEESELATMMYQDLVDKYGGEQSVDEVFGWSAKEKDDKALKQKIEQAKQEVQNYNFNRVFFIPGQNANADGIKKSKEVRINGVKEELPLLAELMPELFDLNQGIVRTMMKSGNNEYEGMIPLNWSLLKDSSGYINQEKAIQEFVQRLDALGQKIGLREEEQEDFVPHGSYTVSNAGVNENIHNTPMMGGILNSKGTAGYDPDATNKNQKTGKDFYDPEKEGERLKRLRSLEEQEDFVPHGSYTVSNAGGYEIMLSPDGEQARVRDAFGSDNPETSDWLDIEWVSGKPVIDPYGYNIPMSQVMRIR